MIVEHRCGSEQRASRGTNPGRSRGRALVPYALVVILWMCLALPFLGSVPRVWVDEPWETVPAANLVEHGVLANPVVAASPLESPLVIPQFGFFALLASAVSVLGINPLAARLPLALAGLVTLLLTYRLLVTRTDWRTALTACLFLGVDNYFFVSERTARPEMLVTALGVAALLLALREDAMTGWISGLGAGAIAGFGLSVHPNFVITAIAVACAAFAAHGRKHMLPWLARYVLGILAGVLPYLIYVVGVDASSGFARLKYQLQASGRTGPAASTLAFLKNTLVLEAERYRGYVLFPYRFGIVVVQVAVIVWTAMRPRDSLDRALVVFTAVHLVLFPLLIVNRSSRYLTVLMPVVAILLARWLWYAVAAIASSMDARDHRPSRMWKALLVVALAAIALYAANQAAGDFWSGWRTRGMRYDTVASRLSSAVPPDAKVWGSMTFWYAFHDHPYRTQYGGGDPSAFKPDYVILYDSDIWESTGAASGLSSLDTSSLEPLRDELSALVKARGTEVLRLDAGPYGTPTVYRLDWR